MSVDKPLQLDNTLEDERRIGRVHPDHGIINTTRKDRLMNFTQDHLDELNLLNLFDSASSQEGIKVHQHSADPAMVAAADRLHRKGLITQKDGGYLTPLGNETAEHVQKVLSVLSSSSTPQETTTGAH